MSADFIDSSIILYQMDETDAVKRQVADDLIFGGIREGSAVISFQVVQETLNVLTGKLASSIQERDRERFFTNVLLPLWTVMPSETLYRHALELKGRYGYSFYDSLIIAAAMAAGCTRLYSEDLQHGQRFGRLAIINPFLA